MRATDLSLNIDETSFDFEFINHVPGCIRQIKVL
jgi:hypothetical protein